MLKPSFEIVAVYAIFLSLLFFLFIGDAAQFEEENQTTHSGQVQHEIIGAITFTGRLIGDGLFKNSMLFSDILIPFSMAIDAYLLGVITKVIQIIFKGISKNIFAGK
ncbi:MAG: hypothetical protein RL516_1843 [Bacteroidota bacterium]|jgi:hypothetical protein